MSTSRPIAGKQRTDGPRSPEPRAERGFGRVDGVVAVQGLPCAHAVVAEDPEEDQYRLWGEGVPVGLVQRRWRVWSSDGVVEVAGAQRATVGAEEPMGVWLISELQGGDGGRE